jgi:HNH endonuclease
VDAERLTDLLSAGVKRAEIARRLGVSASTRAPRNRNHLKQRLLELGLKQNACEVCGGADWRGQPLSLALHHVNGRGQDNRLENLQLLCPNCHSQTENFGGRNRRRADDEVGAA